jgi:hypothetical protein
VDWLFFNLFNFEGAGNYLRVASDSYTTLEALSSPGYNFTGRPWGLGAFGTTNYTKNPTKNRPRWLVDAKTGIDTNRFPRLQAYVYFDSLSSEITDYMMPAYESYLGDPFFVANDKPSGRADRNSSLDTW